MLKLKIIIVAGALGLLAACKVPAASMRLLSSPGGILYKDWDSLYIKSLSLDSRRDSFVIITAQGSKIRRPVTKVWGICYDGNAGIPAPLSVYRFYNGKYYPVSDPLGFSAGICLYEIGGGGYRGSSGTIYFSLTSNDPVYKFTRKNVRKICASDPCLKNKLDAYYDNHYWLPDFDQFKKMYTECHP